MQSIDKLQVMLREEKNRIRNRNMVTLESFMWRIRNLAIGRMSENEIAKSRKGQSITKLFGFESQYLSGIYEQKATARIIHGWKLRDTWDKNIKD